MKWIISLNMEKQSYSGDIIIISFQQIRKLRNTEELVQISILVRDRVWI